MWFLLSNTTTQYHCAESLDGGLGQGFGVLIEHVEQFSSYRSFNKISKQKLQMLGRETGSVYVQTVP